LGGENSVVGKIVWKVKIVWYVKIVGGEIVCQVKIVLWGKYFGM
jgi:hypothetical protein